MPRSIYPADFVPADAVADPNRLSITEGLSASVPFTLINQFGSLVPPASLTCQIVSITTGRQIRSATSMTPVAQGFVVLTPAETAMFNQSSSAEDIRIVLVATYEDLTVAKGSYDFKVINES